MILVHLIYSPLHYMLVGQFCVLPPIQITTILIWLEYGWTMWQGRPLFGTPFSLYSLRTVHTRACSVYSTMGRTCFNCYNLIMLLLLGSILIVIFYWTLVKTKKDSDGRESTTEMLCGAWSKCVNDSCICPLALFGCSRTGGVIMTSLRLHEACSVVLYAAGSASRGAVASPKTITPMFFGCSLWRMQ
jgi:hypothetical protein